MVPPSGCPPPAPPPILPPPPPGALAPPPSPHRSPGPSETGEGGGPEVGPGPFLQPRMRPLYPTRVPRGGGRCSPAWSPIDGLMTPQTHIDVFLGKASVGKALGRAPAGRVVGGCASGHRGRNPNGWIFARGNGSGVAGWWWERMVRCGGVTEAGNHGGGIS